ncbi:MAG: hypothetical protein ACLGIA_06190 [Actinomycetes bacterium]
MRGLLTLTLALAPVVAVFTPQAAQALTGSEFDPGNIITDTVFFDSGTMTAEQVQAFLDSKGSHCRSGSVPCLKDYRQTTSDRPAEAKLCQGYTGRPDESAAQIIVRVADSCGINPRVLIVLLQKEQGLVSSTQPTAAKYNTATGYGCPDFAVCDTQYYGFFNQVYSAARRFRSYGVSPGFRYQAGRTNLIQYNPNVSCGSKSVYIENRATAALYNYTPYVPNEAALNFLYGTGDDCSAYGNRNFWRFFTEWFGSTQAGSFLVRSENNPTVYLLVDDAKYPVPSLALLSALDRLGPVGVVSQKFLDARATGPTMGRLVRSTNGTIYFVDAGIKLYVPTCQMAADYGYSCSQTTLLPDAQLALLKTGPSLTSVFETTSGKRFFVQGAAKREVYDAQSLASAGVPATSVRLLESALDHLPYGTPVIRDGVVARSRATGALTLHQGGRGSAVGAALLSQTPLGALVPEEPLDQQSIDRLADAGTLTGLVQSADGARAYALTATGKMRLAEPGQWSGRLTALPDSLLAQIPDEGTIAPSSFVKSSTKADVYLVLDGEKRYVRTWGDLTTLSGGAAPQISTLPDEVLGGLPSGGPVLAPGTLVYAPGSPAVSLVDGLRRRIPVTSFSVVDETGAGALVQVDASTMSKYTPSARPMSVAVSCNGHTYLGVFGVLRRIPDALLGDYRLTPVTLDPLTCSALRPSEQALGRFLRTPDGTIYYVANGGKRWLTSYAEYVRLGGTAANTTAVSPLVASAVPTL